MAEKLPEVWQRGPVEGVCGLLQPVAHALLQADEEVAALAEKIPAEHLWYKPYGMASAGFHLQHLTGVLNRLFTYAKGGQLNGQQLYSLKVEGVANDAINQHLLANKFHKEVHQSVGILKTLDETQLLEVRYVGRQKVPSTMLGLYVHAAEHTMRHVGQLLVTVTILTHL